MKTPTPKQIGFAVWLSRETKRPLPPDYRTNAAAASQFISEAQYWQRISTLPAETQAHIHRIWRGELKNDPGPWDEEWCLEQESKGADLLLLGELRAKGL